MRPGVVEVDPETGAAYLAVRDCDLDPIVATIPVRVDGAAGVVEVFVDVSAGHVVGFEFLAGLPVAGTPTRSVHMATEQTGGRHD